MDSITRNQVTAAQGHLAAKCPVDPIWYRAIEVGAKLGCCMEMVDIALLCSSQASIFLRPAQYQQAADYLMKSFQHSLSDHLTLANAFNAYMQVRQLHQQEGGPKFDLAEWCSRFFLNIQALEAVYLQRQELRSFMESQAKFAPTHASVQDMTCVRKALAIAFCTHTAIHHSGDVYRTVHENTSALLAPLSSLVGGDYEWIVYTTLRTSGGKQYLETATAINAEWLVEARMPTKGNGSLRQPQVKRSLDDAKARNRTAQGQLAP
ncbi:oligonucleotide/oligosaccharide-binding (OB)-fold and helicase associated domain protein [Metarhizium robertsii]|uniref:Oligonucleotide/oligosaccharide-binding (OB)-fold and helicase associated domain protein n=1 Tax=Metarhizium robertsii TaxID=568076 RepID=A0A014QYF5_9HYPO|nr:oligonucleotide/oligosaccharide-binding (OB)-fold and helicase associated domain protein [Metarhizium robertsii]